MSTNSNTSVSFFESIKNPNPTDVVDLLDIVSDIKLGKWKKEIELCRADISLKKLLPCFTPTGIFSYRTIKDIKQFSQIICFDLDNVNDIDSLKEKCSAIPWIWIAFVSPSGYGVKILVKTDSKLEDYAQTEYYLAKLIFEKTGYSRDERAKDLARLQFVSYDPKIYVNRCAEVFKIGDSKL